MTFVSLHQTSGYAQYLRRISELTRATQPRAFLLLSWVISLVFKYQTRYLSQSRRSWATPPSRLLSICALNLQRFVNNPSNKQTDFQAGKQQRKNHHPNMEPGSSHWSHFDISSPTLLVSKVMCCQLAGLIGMEVRLSLGGTRSSTTSTLGSGTVCGAYSRSLLGP